MSRCDYTSALFVIDIQNDFADPKGSLYVSGSDAIVGSVNGEIEQAAAADALVVYEQDWHPKSTAHDRRPLSHELTHPSDTHPSDTESSLLEVGIRRVRLGGVVLWVDSPT